MKRSAYILLLMLISLMMEPLSPWQARGRSAQVADKGTARRIITVNASRPYQDLNIALDKGAFVLKNLQLFRAGRSTRLEGKLFNQTNQRWNGAVFAVRAYDTTGRPLRGVEEETIFSVNQIGKGKSALINSGYGVWLEGIPYDNIARLEVVLLEDEPHTAHLNARGKSTNIEE
jgi:hypothetical protein